MKYRTDFVTNSSSTSFGVSAGSMLLSLILSLINACSGEDNGDDEEDNEKDGPPIYLSKTIMPSPAKLKAGETEPVWLYTQAIMQTEKGDVVMSETSNITYSILTPGGWVNKGDDDNLEDWRVVDLYGITPAEPGTAPANISVKAGVKIGKRSLSTKFSIPYEAAPAVVMKPAKYDFLSGTEDDTIIKVTLENGGKEPWELDFELDSFAQKICNVSWSEKAENGMKADLKITEADTVTETKGNTGHYDKGRVTVTATRGEEVIKDYTDVYVWREGLYLLTDAGNVEKSSGNVVVEGTKDDQGNMKISTFEMRYMKWNTETKKLVASTTVFTSDEFSFGDFKAEGQSENMLKGLTLGLKYKGERQSNLPSGKFEAKMSGVVPGKKDSNYTAKIDAMVETDDDTYSIEIPFKIKPAAMYETAKWQEEYDYCKKIITEILPESVRAKSLEQLDEKKFFYGITEMKEYRHKLWDEAQKILFDEANSYLEIANWNDNVVTALDWTAWVGDRCFALAIGSLTGPVGSFVATQIKEGFVDFIVKLQEMKSSDTFMDFVGNFAWSRVGGAGGGAIDMKVTEDPKFALAYLTGFYIYKFGWHWFWDMDESNQRKGAFEAVKSAGWDLTALGIEKGLEEFIKKYGSKSAADPENYLKAVKKFVEYAKTLFNETEIHITT